MRPLYVNAEDFFAHVHVIEDCAESHIRVNYGRDRLPSAIEPRHRWWHWTQQAMTPMCYGRHFTQCSERNCLCL